MTIFDIQRSRAIEANRLEYGDDYTGLHWANSDDILRAETERDTILSALEGRVRFGYRGTKLDCQDLSPGCQLCGEGAWSCLFINQICNGHCFYCPTEQTQKAVPSTNGILIHKPREYATYLKQFNFRGASISGGEPFLTFERTLSYITGIRDLLGPHVYLWLYTNGISVTREKLELLAKAGLNEIRLDISAIDYDIRPLGMAAEVIETVTVEIPAIPEDFELLKRIMPDLKAQGVRHLNLHHLRCTPHNMDHMVRRGYTLLHGPNVTVLESELTALRLLRYAKDQGIGLPVNYCSFAFKNRFQALGQRRRLAPYVLTPYEDITAAGAVRRMSIKGDPSMVGAIALRLEREGSPPSGWHMTKAGDRIYFRESLWRLANPEGHALHVDYYLPTLTPNLSYRSSFKEIPLNNKRTLFVEKVRVVSDKRLEGDAVACLAGEFLNVDNPGDQDVYLKYPDAIFKRDLLPLPDAIKEIYEYEDVFPGLQEYF